MIRFRNFVLFLLFALSANIYAKEGGIQLERTRLLIENGKTSVSMAVKNHYDRPVLASAFVSNFDGTPSEAFAVTPSIFQIRADSAVKTQVVLLKKLPEDRESVFWMNVRTVLSENSNSDINVSKSSSLELAIGQRIKLFYRPITITEKCEDAAKTIIFHTKGKELIAKNSSGVSLSILEIETDGDVQKIADTVMPKSTSKWELKIPVKSSSLFTYIDENGNLVKHLINITK